LTGKTMNTLTQDLRYGIRMLARNPAFSTVAVLTLALGIGANTAIFSVVNTVLLKPLSYAQPDRLVAVELTNSRGALVTGSLSFPNFFDLRARNHVFEHFVTGHSANLTLTGHGAPVQLDVGVVTWDIFPALGIPPALGRGFLPSEEKPGTRVVVLSHKLWQSQFGGDLSVVGRSITLNQLPYTVVGVAPSGFLFPVDAPDLQLWTTIADDREMFDQRGARMLTGLGRLESGIGIRQARADLNVIAAGLARQYPDYNTNYSQASIRPELDTLVGESRAPLLILLGAVGMVLLIACANIANLLLVRTANRAHEMAVRAALGAGRPRVVRQLLTESLLLAMLGGAAGVLLAEYALRAALPLGGQSIPRLAETRIDAWALAFSFCLALLTSILFGLAPALQAAKADLTGSLQSPGRGGTKGHDRIRGALVIAQVTLGLVLVSAAGLLMATFLHLETSDLGFRADHLLTFWFSLPDSQYNTARQEAFYGDLLERVRALPGVQSAAGVWPLPLGGDNATVAFNIEERPAAQPNRPHARMAFATPGYFSTAGIPLLRGRFFTDRDDANAPRVLIVNKAFADKYFPGEDVLGKRVTSGAGAPGRPPSPEEIVGVVGSAKLFALDAEPEPMYYFPYKQLPWRPPSVVVRSAVPPQALESAIRAQMAALDPAVPVFQVSTMDELLATQLTEERFHTLLLACFAGIALLLTMIGLYGVMAYSVTRRTREIGVRIALGASRSLVLSMVLKQAVVLLAVGLALGLTASLATDRLLESMLFGISSLHPGVLGLSALLMLLTGLLAAYLPARRATKVDPMVALRYE
jgi:predicted permease